jgi:hypothetical protein
MLEYYLGSSEVLAAMSPFFTFLWSAFILWVSYVYNLLYFCISEFIWNQSYVPLPVLVCCLVVEMHTNDGEARRKGTLGRWRRRWVCNIQMVLREIWWSGMEWSVLLRMGASAGFLWTRKWTFGIHKMLESSWVVALLAASQEGLSAMK